MRRELSNTALIGVVTTLIVVFGLVLILVFTASPRDQAENRAAEAAMTQHHTAAH